MARISQSELPISATLVCTAVLVRWPLNCGWPVDVSSENKCDRFMWVFLSSCQTHVRDQNSDCVVSSRHQPLESNRRIIRQSAACSSQPVLINLPYPQLRPVWMTSFEEPGVCVLIRQAHTHCLPRVKSIYCSHPLRSPGWLMPLRCHSVSRKALHFSHDE